RLDQNGFACFRAAEPIPLWSAARPEGLERALGQRDAKPIEKGGITVFGIIVVAQRRAPVNRPEADLFVERMRCVVDMPLHPALAPFRAQRLLESRHRYSCGPPLYPRCTCLSAIDRIRYVFTRRHECPDKRIA